MKAGEAPLVKFFIAALFSDETALERALAGCEAAFGPIDYQSQTFPFNVTRYYENEMGQGLMRQFISFEELSEAGNLGIYKAATNTWISGIWILIRSYWLPPNPIGRRSICRMDSMPI